MTDPSLDRADTVAGYKRVPRNLWTTRVRNHRDDIASALKIGPEALWLWGTRSEYIGSNLIWTVRYWTSVTVNTRHSSFTMAKKKFN